MCVLLLLLLLLLLSRLESIKIVLTGALPPEPAEEAHNATLP